MNIQKWKPKIHKHIYIHIHAHKYAYILMRVAILFSLRNNEINHQINFTSTHTHQIKSILHWHTYTYLQCTVHLYDIYMILFVYTCRYISSYVCLYICPHGFELQVHRPSIKGTKLLLRVIKAIIITTCMFVCMSFIFPSRWPPSRKLFMVSGTSWKICILKRHGVYTHATYTQIHP